MPFEKGRQKTGGIKKGSLKKETIEFKEAINNLISYATPQMVEWLQEVALEDKNKALDHIYKFAQFGYPLLARTTMVGDEKAPVVIKDKTKEDLLNFLKSVTDKDVKNNQ